MSQYLANQAMLKVPQVTHSDARDSEAFRQMRRHRFNTLADALTGLEQPRRIRRSVHVAALGCDNVNPLALCQQRLAERIQEAFVSWHQSGTAGHQITQQLNVMGSRGQQGKGGDHAAGRDAQTQLEAVVMQLLRRTVTIIGFRLKAAIASAARVDAHRQRQRIDHLNRLAGLSADLGQTVLNSRFHLPQVGRLSHKHRALGQTGKEVSIMRPEVAVNVFVSRLLEVFSADFHGDDFFIRQRGCEAAPPQPLCRGNCTVMLAHQTIHSDDKLVSIHWRPPANSVFVQSLFSGPFSGGSKCVAH